MTKLSAVEGAKDSSFTSETRSSGILDEVNALTLIAIEQHTISDQQIG